MTHSNELLEGVAGRIDKVDLLFRLDYDLFQQEYTALVDIFDAIEEATGARIGHRVRCFGVEKESGHRIYGISTWGAACDDFLNLLSPAYYPNITRIDFRVETEITPSQLPLLKGRIEEFNPKHRNVTDFNTRGRNKEFARNAGGHGVAFGSHKSDVRVTTYKRRGETGAIEVQVSGDTVQGILLYTQQLQQEPHGPSLYAATCDGIIAKLYTLVNEMGFKSPAELMAFVGESEYKLTLEEIQEYRRIEAENAFRALDHGAQTDFFKLVRATVVGNFNDLG